MGNKTTKDLLPPSFSIENPETVTYVSLSPNKKYLAIGYDNKNIKLFDLN